MKNNVAVVILNWNGRAMLQRFLPSVLECTDAHVIVADNGSTDDSLNFLATNYPTLRTICLDKNYGFAEGYNRALAMVDAEYYVLLNSDVECTPHWLDQPISMLQSQPDLAVVQPKLRMFDDKRLFEYAGGAGGFIDNYGYPFCRGRLFSSIEVDNGQYDDPCDIFWASGAAMFVRASVWHNLGGLDADFFAHMEEIDFCWRVHNAGLRVAYCPQSVVYHVGGGTLPKSSPFKTQLNFRNNLSMLYKNLPDGQLRRVMFARLWLDRIAAIKFLVEGHRGEYRAVRTAHREFRKNKASLREKRCAIAPHTVPHLYRGMLLIEYYLLRRTTFSALRGKFTTASTTATQPCDSSACE